MISLYDFLPVAYFDDKKKLSWRIYEAGVSNLSPSSNIPCTQIAQWLSHVNLQSLRHPCYFLLILKALLFCYVLERKSLLQFYTQVSLLGSKYFFRFKIPSSYIHVYTSCRGKNDMYIHLKVKISHKCTMYDQAPALKVWIRHYDSVWHRSCSVI